MKNTLSALSARALLGCALGISMSAPVLAQAESSYELVIRDHRFEPEVLNVPAGKKFKLLVKNLDATPEEFESHDLKREKVIAGKASATINLGPLKPGSYKFVGEYHEKTAQGRIVAK